MLTAEQARELATQAHYYTVEQIENRITTQANSGGTDCQLEYDRISGPLWDELTDAGYVLHRESATSRWVICSWKSKEV